MRRESRRPQRNAAVCRQWLVVCRGALAVRSGIPGSPDGGPSYTGGILPSAAECRGLQAAVRCLRRNSRRAQRNPTVSGQTLRRAQRNAAVCRQRSVVRGGFFVVRSGISLSPDESPLYAAEFPSYAADFRCPETMLRRRQRIFHRPRRISVGWGDGSPYAAQFRMRRRIGGRTRERSPKERRCSPQSRESTRTEKWSSWSGPKQPDLQPTP